MKENNKQLDNQQSINALAKELGISHNTVRRFIEAHEKELKDYVVLEPIITSKRVIVKDYKGLKEAIKEYRR